MKNLITLFLLLVLTGNHLLAQLSGYEFEKSEATYESLSSATTVSKAGWDDDIYGVKLPFTFSFAGAGQDSLYISDGYAFFSETTDEEVAILDADLIDKDSINMGSTISYQVSGSSPNRIFKVEWANAGFFEDTVDYEDSAYFQLWLYETSGQLEMHYGAHRVANAFVEQPGPRIGLIDYKNESTLFLAGSPSDPSVGSNPDNDKFLTGMPVNGTVYSFSPKKVSVEERLSVQLGIYPNPASDQVLISLPGATGEFELVNPAGMIARRFQGTLDGLQVSLAGLNPGIYLVQVRSQNQYISRKLLVR